MEIDIDIESPIPLFNQLVEQIKRGVTKGQLLPGAPLPSIRQLANDLAVNSKTVAKAYKLLERDGVIESKGYRGSFIHQSAKQNCHFDINQWLIDKLTDAVSLLKKSGATNSEIRNAFNHVINTQQEQN
ncbi:GntR family transcriptional regulator [Thalassotalea marina]|uniref:GntR family transcriptional regulator n=1 Tax=Thalassotalea marina TaxID=1673741 RepID=A0A919EP15_9GAMM|nr:GntR family transcriptional regulator [Thalassotalea marina]GHG01693.1 GntR family transcriptional regulator [Thalassotalea marina]